MKRIGCIVLILALLFSLVTVPFTVCGAEQGFSFVVADRDVALSNQPWDTYSQGCSVSEGEILYYSGISTEYNGYTWYGVLRSGMLLFICARYATLSENVSEACTTAEIVLRREAGTEYQQITTVPRGKTLTILDCGWDRDGTLWLYVRWNGQSGYISSRFTRIVDAYEPGPYGYAVTAVLTERHMATRSGPSTGYYETGSFYSRGDSVKLYSRVWDSVNEIWWVQAEAKESGQLKRVYTGSWRFSGQDLYDLPEEYARYDATVSRGQTLRMGPGSGYAYYGASISSGKRVTVYNIENGWAQIECTVNGTRYRGWVEQSALR